MTERPSSKQHPDSHRDQPSYPAESPKPGTDPSIHWIDRSEERPEPTAWADISRFHWHDVNDLYDLLEVSPRASVEVIRKAYQALAMKFHPDRQPVERRDEAEKLMTRLNSARDILLNSDRRKAYDLKRSQSNPER